VKTSETRRNSAKDSLRVFQIAKVLCAKSPAQGRVSPLVGCLGLI
jgi:hypothetical protein